MLKELNTCQVRNLVGHVNGLKLIQAFSTTETWDLKLLAGVIEELDRCGEVLENIHTAAVESSATHVILASCNWTLQGAMFW